MNKKRIQTDPNEIKIVGDICCMVLYDRNSNPKSLTYFDVEVLDSVRVHKWYFAKGYVVSGDNVKKKRRYLHRVILNCDDDKLTDHINGDTLDNRKLNLRMATHLQNSRNQQLRVDNSSGYRGVCFDKKAGKWMAYIRHNRQRTYLGYFGNSKDAARAYDMAAIRYHGDFASLNFV